MNLGDKVKDEITGLEGVVVGLYQRLDKFLPQPVRVQPCALNRGSPLPEVLMSENRLTVINERTGGPTGFKP